MSESAPGFPDDEREVPLDDDVELELPPPTLDAGEQVEETEDDVVSEERASAIEAGEVEPS